MLFSNFEASFSIRPCFNEWMNNYIKEELEKCADK